jgi:ABC-type proline/glycine betaine transport system, permease component
VVVRAVTQLDVASGFEGGLAVVLLAIFLDRVTAAFGHRTALSRMLRARKRRTPPSGGTAETPRRSEEPAQAPV